LAKRRNGKEFIHIALSHLNIQAAKFIRGTIVLLEGKNKVACPYFPIFDKNGDYSAQ
jgi:hypothetical protein